MRKKILIFAICLMLVSTLFSGVGFALAEQTEIEPVVIRPLSSPIDVIADQSGYYVLDEEGLLYVNDGQSRTFAFSASAIASNGTERFTVINGEVFSFSVDEQILLNKIENVTGATHIAVSNDKLYVTVGERLDCYSFDGNLISSVNADGVIADVTATNDSVYYSTNEGIRSNIFDGVGNLVYPLVRAKKIMATTDGLFGLSRDGEIVRVNSEGEKIYYDDCFIECATATQNGLLIVTEQGEIKRLGADGSITLIGASASDYEGFYNHPLDAVARMGQLYVADYLNNRVAVTKGKNTTKYLSVARPMALCVDNNGYVYVAHSATKVTRFTPELAEADVSYSFDQTVSSLKVSADNSIYALSGKTLFKLSQNSKTEIKSQIDAFDFTSKLFYAKSNQVFDGSDKLLFTATGNVSAICVDSGNNVFALVDNGDSVSLIKYDGTVKNVLSLSADACSLFLSKTGTMTPFDENIHYGDLLICHKSVSKIGIYESETVGVADTPDYVPAPETYDNESIVRTLLYDGYLYSSFNEISPVMRVTKNTKILVLKYEIPSHPGVAYCATENITGDLMKGYLFKSSLSSPEVYRQPPENTAVVYASGVSLYYLPSLSAEKLKALPVGEKITLMTFASYSSIDGNEWYRAQHSDGTTGYVPTDSVSIRNFIPGDIRPQYNAEIISYNGSLYAPAFVKADDGTFVKLGDEMLFTGEKVEVIGNFDTSQKWTQVKYFDEQLGTLTCYVETVFLKYNSVSVVQIVAIVVAVVTFILLVLLLVRMYLRHRKI